MSTPDVLVDSLFKPPDFVINEEIMLKVASKHEPIYL